MAAIDYLNQELESYTCICMRLNDRDELLVLGIAVIYIHIFVCMWPNDCNRLLVLGITAIYTDKYQYICGLMTVWTAQIGVTSLSLSLLIYIKRHT